jgi:plasmid stability protein
MILTLDLPPELEQHLAKEAAQHGLSVEAMTLQLLATSLNIRLAVK